MTTSNTDTNISAGSSPGRSTSGGGQTPLGGEELDTGTSNASPAREPDVAPNVNNGPELIADDDADLPSLLTMAEEDASADEGVSSIVQKVRRFEIRRIMLQGQQMASAADPASTAATRPGIDIIDDDTGPTPPVSMSDAAVVECPIVKKRAETPGVELCLDCEDPPLYTDTAAAEIDGEAFKSDEPNLLPVPSPPNLHDEYFHNDMEYGEKERSNPPSGDTLPLDEVASYTSREEIEEDLVSSVRQYGNLEDGHARDTHSEADESQTTNFESDNESAIHIAEAYAVDGDMIVATQIPPVLPWWKQKQNRLYTWALLSFLSAIALTAYKTNPDHEKNRNSMDYYSYYGWDSLLTACASVSLSLSALASFSHLSPNNAISRRFVGTILEGVTALFIVLSWASALVVHTDPSKGLAMMWAGQSNERVADYQQYIKDGNLYFSSWGSAICALILFFMYLGEKRNKILMCFKMPAVHNGMGLGYTMKWILLVCASLVVIIESNWFKLVVCENTSNGTEETTCDRNTWGIVTGSIGIAVSALMTLCSYAGQDSARVTITIGFFMAVNFIFCAGMLCFGYGPATSPGNQFFSAWAGVFLSLSLFGGALKEYLITRDRDDVPTDTEDEENTGWGYKQKAWGCVGIILTFCIIATVLVAVTRASESKSRERCNVDFPLAIGNGYCDGGQYNTEGCRWDGGDCAVDNYPNCHVNYPDNIGNGRCENYDSYNTEECGCDGGDCIEFNQNYPNCHVEYPSYIGNGQCENSDSYNTDECGWDGGDCTEFNEKYPNCHVEFPSEIGDGQCKNFDLFNTEECGWDGGDCIEFNKKFPKCRVDNPSSFGDGHCNNSYNTEECGWDGGDCIEFNEKYPNCHAQHPSALGNGECDDFYPYNTEECGWDGGDCIEFNQKYQMYPGCHVNIPSSLGNGYCDGSSYNTEVCGWDGGDCIEFNQKYHGCLANKNYLNDGRCDRGQYNTEECGWDGGDCLIDYYPDCHVDNPSYIGNGRCNSGPYNSEECGWDGGDCPNMSTSQRRKGTRS